MKVINIGDLHFPYAKQYLVNKALKRIEEEQPDVVIQGGDLYDMYCFGPYNRRMNFITPGVELKRGTKQATNFWKEVKKLAPKARCIQLLGNHDIRMLKKLLAEYPELYDLLKKAFDELYTFEGVEVKRSDRDFVKIDGIVYCHGWMARHLDHFKCSVIRQHDHKTWMFIRPRTKNAKGGGITIMTTYTIDRSPDIDFEISCGTYCDDTKVPFGYTNSKRNNWKAGLTIATKDYVRLEVL